MLVPSDRPTVRLPSEFHLPKGNCVWLNETRTAPSLTNEDPSLASVLFFFCPLVFIKLYFSRSGAICVFLWFFRVLVSFLFFFDPERPEEPLRSHPHLLGYLEYFLRLGDFFFPDNSLDHSNFSFFEGAHITMGFPSPVLILPLILVFPPHLGGTPIYGRPPPESPSFPPSRAGRLTLCNSRTRTPPFQNFSLPFFTRFLTFPFSIFDRCWRG